MGRFSAALRRARACGRTSLIAEIKPRSADGVDLLRGRRPTDIARAYAAGGATCLSVVTGKWFGGTPELLAEVAAESTLPILCKDFIRNPNDVRAARDRGASAVLVTLKVLADIAVDAVIDSCRELGLDPFVEVSSPAELARAQARALPILAINNKDIETRERSGEGIDRSLQLKQAGADTVWVSASGIGAGDARTLARAGFEGLLVGTSLLEQEDPEAATAAMVAALARPLVKICGVCRQDELEALAPLGVDFVGLSHLPGEPVDLSPEVARQLAQACPRALQPWLVTIERESERLNQQVARVAPAAVQLSGFTRPSHATALRRAYPDLGIVQVVHARDGKIMEEAQLAAYADAGVDLFLLDRVGEGRLGSTGHGLDDATLTAFRALRPPRPWLIAGGLRAADVGERLALSGAAGVDVFSSVRSEAGIDAGRVTALVAAVRGGAT
ncbi:MAG TPA: hypothetical protein VMZ28_23375 [Kofleriaceae bacterium]|nr:hypothetical protein [Kofleriaceae bacterium]